MAGKRSLFFRNLQSVLKKVGKPVAYSLLVATTMLCIIVLPVLEKAIASPPSYSTAASAQTQDLLNQGKKQFDAGQYEAAVQDLLQAVKVAQINKDTLTQAIALSNLALAYEQLGKWNEANASVEESLKLLQAQTGASLPVRAQALNVQGNLQKAQGQTENALKTWQQAATIYTQLKDNNSLIRNRISQAQALQTLGSYKQAIEILEKVGKVLENQPDSLEKVRSLRTLGDAYQAVGRLEEAREKLEASLPLAIQNSKQDISPIYFSLGNLVRAEISQAPPEEPTLKNTPALQEQIASSYEYFQEAVKTATTPTTIVQVQLNQFSLLVSNLPQFNNVLLANLPSITPVVQSVPEASSQSDTAPIRESLAKIEPIKTQTIQFTTNLLELLPQIRQQLDKLPPSRTTVYAQINFAQNLTKLKEVANSAIKVDKQLKILIAEINKNSIEEKSSEALTEITPATLPPQTSKPGNPPFLSETAQISWRDTISSSLVNAANLLTKAAAQARTLKDKRAESYALSTLAELYGQSAQQPEQWAEVENLSRRALLLAQESNAPDIAYRLLRQLGRALKIQGKVKESRAAYKVAVQYLQNLRKDLVAINQDVQFTFRDSVEPIYREAVAVLLPAAGETPNQQDLEDARQTLEDLQLAELDNFFREACIEGRKVKLDELAQGDELAQDNPTAFIYPIILSKQQLGVIAKIPNQKELRYVTAKDDDIEKTLKDLREQLPEYDRLKDAQSNAKKVYDWLIAPFESQLPLESTLVFVLDGAFRNVPMAALYDGKNEKYLVQKYAIALSPGLQLLDPKPFSQQQLKALTVGLSEPPDEKFEKLPAVTKELELIQKRLPDTQALSEEEFTSQKLEENINSSSFPVVHMATHGSFSSRKEDTFILAYDGLINTDKLTEILQSRERTREEPIELLVLSACQMATGDNRAALGLAGIAVRSGARSTLASLWSIGDESTASLIDRFYDELIKGKMTKAQALRAAQLKLMEKDSEYRDIRYWAPYVLVGNWL